MKATPRPLRINPWMISALGLAVILISIQLFGPSRADIPVSGEDTSPLGTATSVVSAEEIYKNLICACCGKTIAECTCGMAKERRAFVDGLVTANKSERDIYKEVFKKYGEEILVNRALAAEIKEELIAEAPEDRPIISIEPESIDLGKVSMAQGEVKTIFKVKNIGQTDLKLSGMETSCMCTTVILRKDGRESPIFGMHDNPTDWSETLAPGEEAELTATFDPAYHGPEGTGAVTRTITVFSDDPIDFSKKVQFDATVTK